MLHKWVEHMVGRAGDQRHVCSCQAGIPVDYATPNLGGRGVALVSSPASNIVSKLVRIPEQSVYCWYCKSPSAACKQQQKCKNSPVSAFMKPVHHHD